MRNARVAARVHCRFDMKMKDPFLERTPPLCDRVSKRQLAEMVANAMVEDQRGQGSSSLRSVQQVDKRSFLYHMHGQSAIEGTSGNPKPVGGLEGSVAEGFGVVRVTDAQRD
jgi:hypothetical protein